MIRNLYARIEISGETIQKAAQRDRELMTCMASLSDKHKKKAMARIQGQRWGKVLHSEVEALITDIKRSFPL